MRIGIENMPCEGPGNFTGHLDLVQAIDHAAIGITLDTSHANMCQLDIPEMIHKFREYLIATHISDNDGSGDQHRTPGGGNIDWTAVAAALRNIGFDGTINFEIPGERHRVPELRRLKACFALKVAQWLIRLIDADHLPQHAPQDNLEQETD